MSDRVPPWIEAIGTSGAFLIAAVVFWQQLLDRRAAAARAFNAWAIRVRERRLRNEMEVSLSALPGQSVEVQTVNGGHEPVYDVWLSVRLSYDPLAGSMARDVPVIGPGSGTVWVDGVELPEGGLADLPYVDLAFTDSAGRRWRRLHTGKLERVPKERPWRKRRWQKGRPSLPY